MNLLALGMLSPKLWLVVALALAVSHCGAYRWGASHETKDWRAKWEQQQAATQRAIALEQAKQRDIEARWQDRADAAQKELDDARKTIDEQGRHLAGLRLDAGRLRDQLAAYAAGAAGANPGATCEDRAQALAAYAADLGAAAAEVGRTAAIAARERDQYAAEVVACVAAWPKAPSVTGPSDDN